MEPVRFPSDLTTGITRMSQGRVCERFSLGSVDVPRNDSASSGVRACLYLREIALDMPFGLTTPGGQPVDNSSLRKLVGLSPVYRESLTTVSEAGYYSIGLRQSKEYPAEFVRRGIFLLSVRRVGKMTAERRLRSKLYSYGT